MFTGIEKNSAFHSLHALANTGTPKTPADVKALLSKVVSLQAQFTRLVGRALEQSGHVLGTKVDPEHWGDLVREDLNEALLDIDMALNEYDGIPPSEDEEPPYSFMEHAFGAADHGVERRNAA